MQFCRWPQEINGSYYIDGYASYSTSGTATGGVFGVALQAGGGGGLTGFFCLDSPYHPTTFKRAADPKPPSAWKNKIEPEKCEPLDNEVIQIPGAVPPTPPQQFPTGAVTNPGDGNPSTTENPDNHG